MGIGYGFRGRVSVRRQNIQFVQYKTLLRLWRVPTKRVNQTCELYVSERVRERERERERGTIGGYGLCVVVAASEWTTP